MKVKKTLDNFCRRLVALDIDIFGLRKQAQDAEPEKDVEWRTLENGVHFPIKGGESVKKAAEKFIAKKETEKGKVSQRGRTGISKGVPEAMQKAEKKLKEMNESLAKQTPMLPKKEGTIGGRGRVAFPEQSKSAQPKSAQPKQRASGSEVQSHVNSLAKELEFEKKRRHQGMSKEDIAFEEIETQHKKNISRFKQADETYTWARDRYWKTKSPEDKKAMEEAYAYANEAHNKMLKYENEVYLPAAAKKEAEKTASTED